MPDTTPAMSHTAGLSSGRVLHDWWPLAASWGLMGLELPIISVVLGNLPNAEIMLAAFSGIVFPLALLVESPIIMMLAASTALSRDLDSFNRLQRFMTVLSIGLTALHALMAFTPLWTLVVVPILDIPPEINGPARIGFAWMLIWTWAIADRRFRQGMLIQFGRREVIATGTLIRLIATVGTLVLLARAGVMGVVVATVGLSVGVIVEAGYVRFRSIPVVRGPLRQAPTPASRLTTRRLLTFYLPLALTPMLILAAQPIGAAGMTRMPMAVESLALWGPLGGLVFLLRSAGIAFNEVVIRLSNRPGSTPTLRRFAWCCGLVFSALLSIVAFTPLSGIWFGRIVGLKPELVEIGVATLWLAAPIPLLTFLQSLYQGVLVNARRTRPITESVACYLVLTIAGIGFGILHGGWTGLMVAIVTYTIANVAQAIWLYLRAREIMLRPVEATADGTQTSTQGPNFAGELPPAEGFARTDSEHGLD